MLETVDLNQHLTRKAYDKELPHLQVRLRELHFACFRKRIPAVFVFEGWDAAGKGGAIKRMTALMDPRGYKVWPIAAPGEEERAHHYLWRFATRMPPKGTIGIFDRSWYGRVLVERVEGFATTPEWRRAYDEINAFERMHTEDGCVLLKFFLHIDQDEQQIGRRIDEFPPEQGAAFCRSQRVGNGSRRSAGDAGTVGMADDGPAVRRIPVGHRPRHGAVPPGDDEIFGCPLARPCRMVNGTAHGERRRVPTRPVPRRRHVVEHLRSGQRDPDAAVDASLPPEGQGRQQDRRKQCRRDQDGARAASPPDVHGRIATDPGASCSGS